jgi:outer membrane protein assembly factor BamB
MLTILFVSLLITTLAHPPGSHVVEPVAPPANLWTRDLRAPSYGSAAGADIDGDGKPEIVFGTYFNDEHTSALNAEDGTVLWKQPSDGGPIDTSVLLVDVNDDDIIECIYGDSAYGTLYCRDGGGELVWTYKGQSGTDSPPAAADLDGDGSIEIVYGTMKNINGSGNGHVNVLRGATGECIWTAEVPGHVQSEPALVDLNDDGTLDVLVTNWMGDDHLRALNGIDGSLLWMFETGDWIYHGVSVHDFDQDNHPEIVVADRAGTVWLLNHDGTIAWKATLEKEQKGMVFGPTSLVDVEHDGSMEIVVCGQHVHLLDAKGHLRWRHELSGGSIARGVAVGHVNDDDVPDLVYGHGCALQCIRSDTGAVQWTLDLGVKQDQPYERIDHAPLLLDINDDGVTEIFVIIGRGLSGEYEQDNYGRAVMISCGVKSTAGAGQSWTTFRGNNRRTGMNRATGKPAATSPGAASEGSPDSPANP